MTDLRKAAAEMLAAYEQQNVFALRSASQDLRAALAAPQQEPVAWIQHHKAGDNLLWDDPGGKKTALYATPPGAVSEAECARRVASERERCAQMGRGIEIERRAASLRLRPLGPNVGIEPPKVGSNDGLGVTAARSEET